MKKLPNTPLLMEALSQRILILDGAMGTMFRSQPLTEADFHKGPFAGMEKDLASVKDVLNITFPESPAKIHNAYLEAGADIIETNTFNSQAVVLKEFGLESFAYELNKAGAVLARECADKFSTKEKPRFVAGSMGPTGRSCSMSPDPDNPGARNITFDELAEGCYEAAKGLIDGGVDMILLETAFDTLNIKAAIAGITRAAEERGVEVPLMISGTISDASGRLLSGQNVSAFLISISHAPNLLSVGFNCALGAAEMKPHLQVLAENAPFMVSAYPNAGLPNEAGQYTQTPEVMGGLLKEFAAEGLLNIAGGCCGTTPAHIAAIAASLEGMPPRKLPAPAAGFALAGLDPMILTKDSLFTDIGERTNVAGSRKFLNLIKEKKYEEALRIARDQIEKGARIIDVNMDDSLLDAGNEMENFLRLAMSEPEIALVPFMIDSSRWEVIERGLKNVQGKCVVNSLTLKEGEALFLERAKKVREYGAALLVLACDEEGQADTVERRISICRRAYKLLTEKVGFPPQDIIFDPNVFAVGTGLAEHANYALDFIETARLIHKEMPLSHISGGISNVSFAFRGNNPVREALHSVFLYHSIKAGLDMGIVNPAGLVPYESLDPELRAAAEDVILNKDPEAPERLISVGTAYLEKLKGEAGKPAEKKDRKAQKLEERVVENLVKGEDLYMAEDMPEAMEKYGSVVKVIEGPLMDGMKKVGVLFGEGKMFLPQVIKSARVMKKAVAALAPYMEKGESAGNAGTVIMATVQGDVHDIGKNIASLILQCNNFRVVDLGVMVPRQTIVDAAIKEKAGLIGLSGLIYPSLEEMGKVADELEKRGVSIPLMVGGAATSKVHTALKLAPRYPSGMVIHVADASQDAVVANILFAGNKEAFQKELEEDYRKIRLAHETSSDSSSCEAQAAIAPADCSLAIVPKDFAFHKERFSAEELEKVVAWKEFASFWGKKLPAAEEEKLIADGKKALQEYEAFFQCEGIFQIFPAVSAGNDLLLTLPSGKEKLLAFLAGQNPSLASYVAPAGKGPGKDGKDAIGVFALSCGKKIKEKSESLRKEGEDYMALLLESLSLFLAEAVAELLYKKAMAILAPGSNAAGIRPAPGYPACPDHTLKKDIFELLDAEKNLGITLTSSYMMDPQCSITGFLFAHPHAKYQAVGKVGKEILEEYAVKRNMPLAELLPFLAYME